MKRQAKRLKKKTQTTSSDRSSAGRRNPRSVASRVVHALPHAGAERSTNGHRQPTQSRKPRLVPARTCNGVPRDLCGGFERDRIVLMVRDPYWLHCYWELSHRSIQSAEAALAQEWHNARPILRLLEVGGPDRSAESIDRDIEIHGGCNNWYIDVTAPKRAYRVDIGYRTPSGKFYSLVRSNEVKTPPAGIGTPMDENWADIDFNQADRIYAMSAGFEPAHRSPELRQLFEERLRRPLGTPSATGFGNGACPAGKHRSFEFKLDADLIVYGATRPDARVTLRGQPVALRSDGTFTVRYHLDDSRQVLPAIAASADGVEERTIILAIERNTKALGPLMHGSMDGD